MRRLALAVLPLLVSSAALADAPRRSGLADMGPALQALQRDDAQNPAMLWVQDGEQLGRTPAGTGGKRCADCHGDAPRSMAGVAARYPAWDATTGGALNLAGRINTCRARHRPLSPRP
jgi:sulfur-oxidizing protein SoxA